MSNAKFDQNNYRTMIGVLDDGSGNFGLVTLNPVLKRVLVSAVVTSMNTGIGNTIPGGTEGSVLFLGPGSTLAQNNADFFWDNTNDRLGLGTNTPTATLHVDGTFRLVDGTQALGYVLTSDANGNAHWAPPGTGSSGYDLIQNQGVSVPQETTINLTSLLIASDVGGKTQLDINVTNLANDSTFITAIASSLVADTTFLSNLANSTTFVNDLISNTTFTTNLANNSNFITTLANNSTFITDLTSNSSFISSITNIVNTNPSISIDLTSQVTGILPVANGGTGDGSFTAYAPIFGGTSSTSPLQSGGVGTAGQVLTSNGPGAIATFQNTSTGGGGAGIYGDGSDGNVNITSGSFSSGPITSNSLTRDAYFDNLTLSGGNLNTNGYRLYISGTLTRSSGSWVIFNNGGVGGAGTAGGDSNPLGQGTTGGNGAGGTAGSAAPGVTVPGGLAGKVGVSGGGGGTQSGGGVPAHNGNTGTVGTNTTNSVGANGASTGTGGTGSVGAQTSGNVVGTGGVGGTTGVATAANTLPREIGKIMDEADFVSGTYTAYEGSASSGSGGSGGGGTGDQDGTMFGVTGGQGGGSGGSGGTGGFCLIFASAVVDNGTGNLVEALGGNGGAGGRGGNAAQQNGQTAAFFSGYGGGGSGGPGGSGGVAILVTGSISGTGSATVSAAGGTGGAKGNRGAVAGNGLDNGSDGAVGANGNTGFALQFVV
jgi:hypothetical protein